MMNDPREKASDELRWAVNHGFDFFDLTIEGPGAMPPQINVAELATILSNSGLALVGHTAWYLPFASPFARVRRAAVESVTDTFDLFARLGARWITVHVAKPASKFFSSNDMLEWNRECFGALAEAAAPYGLGIMVEHIPVPDIRVSEIRQMLDVDERLGFHLDVGHAVVGGDRLDGFLKTLGSRLVHVHLSDNHHRHDDHLPLGAGLTAWPDVIRKLQQAGYDDTITLEVFTPDRDYLLLSAQKVRSWWIEEAARLTAAQRDADEAQAAQAAQTDERSDSPDEEDL